jgi:hypothetical protein
MLGAALQSSKGQFADAADRMTSDSDKHGTDCRVLVTAAELDATDYCSH